MQAILKHAAIAWNPVRAIRRGVEEGTLTPGRVLLKYMAVVIACNLVAVSAQKFFFESVAYSMNVELPPHPLLMNNFAQRVLSCVGVLVPVGAVFLLPSSIFLPVGRKTTVASLLALAASWAFYGAALSIPTHFVSGMVVAGDPNAGMLVYATLSIVSTLAIIVLVIVFWYRALHGVLELSGFSIAVIAATVFVTVALLTVGIIALGAPSWSQL